MDFNLARVSGRQTKRRQTHVRERRLKSLRLTHRVSWCLLKLANLLMYSPWTVGITKHTLSTFASSPSELELPVLLPKRSELLLLLPEFVLRWLLVLLVLLFVVELLLLVHPLLLLRAEDTDPLPRAWSPGPTQANWTSVLHTRMFSAIRSMSFTQLTAVSCRASGSSSVLVHRALLFIFFRLASGRKVNKRRIDVIVVLGA